MTAIRQDKGCWQTDYSWSQRGGKWTDLTDVMLVGTADNPRCAQALEEWVGQQD